MTQRNPLVTFTGVQKTYDGRILVVRELLLETPDGQRTAPLTPGQSYTRSVGVQHNVINPTSQEVVFIEIEMR